MDPVTHALAGATLAAAISAEERVRLAALAGALGALAPDLDVLISSAEDPLLQLEMHRQFSHSLLFAPIIGVLLGGLLLPLLGARLEPRQIWLYVTVGALSAGLLDACTSYGTQLLWPFSDSRIAWSVVAVVDPVVTVTLLVMLALALLRVQAGFASAGLTLAVGYLLLGAVQHERAGWVARSLAAQRGHEPHMLELKPTLGNLLVWRSVYRAEDRFWVDAVRTGVFDASITYAGGSLPALGAAASLTESPRQRQDIERFARLSAGYLVRHPRDAEVIGDIRYAMRPDGLEPLWGIALDAASPRAHVGWRVFRDWDAADLARFRAMLAGHVLEGAVVAADVAGEADQEARRGS